MDREEIEKRLYSVLEELAAIEHQRWAHWQRHLHEQGSKMGDGSLVLPADLIMRWERQIETIYDLLSEKEKDSDREQVIKIFPLLIEVFSGTQGRS